MFDINVHIHSNDCFTVSPQYKYQYDCGQQIKLSGILPEEYEVLLSNEPTQGKAERILGQNDVIKVPDKYFQTGEPIYGWIFTHYTPNSGNTVGRFMIPIMKRPPY